MRVVVGAASSLLVDEPGAWEKIYKQMKQVIQTTGEERVDRPAAVIILTNDLSETRKRVHEALGIDG